jgi:hypothetical protein
MTKEAPDANDTLREEGPDGVRRRLDNAKPFKPRLNRKDKVTAEPAAPRFVLKGPKDIKLVTAPSYTVKGILPRGGLSVVWGPPKCDKSFWSLDIAMHIAHGWQYRGRRVRQGLVVYCALEGGGGVQNRIIAWRKCHAGSSADAPFYLLDVPVNVIADHEELSKDIRGQLAPAVPSVIFIDTLNRGLVGSENDSADMAKFIRAADAIRKEFGCEVVLVHHCGIAGGRPRGHSSLDGAVDAMIAVKRDEAGNVIVNVEELRDGASGAVMVCRLENVDLGEDDDGDPIGSLAIVPVEDRAVADVAAARLAKKKAPKGQNKTALDLLYRALIDDGQIAPASNHIPNNVRVTKVATWRSYCETGIIQADDGRDKKRDTQRARYRRAFEWLQANDFIGVWGDYVWATRHDAT